MPGTPTPILSLTVPTVGGDANTWGTELNADLTIIDGLGEAPVVVVNATPYNAITSSFPETVFRCFTGAINMSFLLPAASLCTGKIFLVKKIDSAIGAVLVTPTTGTVDGQASYALTNQYQYVRVYSNGSSFDVIGNN